MFLGRVDDGVVVDRLRDEDPDSVHFDDLVTFHGIGDEMWTNLSARHTQSNRYAGRRELQ